MDVTYKTSDWDKAKQQVGGLIGLGVWGKGMIDDLKDITKNLEKARSDIKEYDVDGEISFSHTSQEDKYTSLFEDFKELHGYTKEVGTIVDDVIDQRFYEDMDAFVESMRNLNIGDYKTENRIGATQIIQDYHAPNGGYEFEKGEVSLEDLFDGDNFYADQVKLEYEEVLKTLDESEEDFTFADYQQVALNTHAFEYNSIKDQQMNKEFWVSIAALAVIITATVIFPPAGLALGAAYGAYELTNAVRGEDLASGRELGTGERWFRGLLAPLDIVPGLGAAKKFATTGRVTSKVADFSKIGLKTADLAKVRQSIGNTVQTARTKGLERISQLKEAGKATAIAAGKKLEKSVIDAGKVIDKGITAGKQATSNLSPQHVTPEGVLMREGVENTHAAENIFRGQMENVKGVFGSGKNADKGRLGVSGEKPFVGKGQHFANGRNNKLKPNIRYKTGEFDYIYETDHLGRISKFETDHLQLTTREKRLSHNPNTPGKIKGQDHAGHLAGDRFGGSPKLDNLVSQISDVNLKQYKKIEDTWAAALKETPPKKVTVDVDIKYSTDKMRPDKFIVNYTIDGKWNFKVLKN